MTRSRRRPILDGVDLGGCIYPLSLHDCTVDRWALGYDPAWATQFAVALLAMLPTGDIVIAEAWGFREETIRSVEARVSREITTRIDVIGVDPACFCRSYQTGMRDVDYMGAMTENIVSCVLPRTTRLAYMWRAFAHSGDGVRLWISTGAREIERSLQAATGSGHHQHLFDAVSYGVYALTADRPQLVVGR